MILADKIVLLRRKNGWSQEQLAERLGVSRQSVSKWEGAQSTPELDKIVLLSEIFGVSTDYLLKDSAADPTPAAAPSPAQDTPEKAEQAVIQTTQYDEENGAQPPPLSVSFEIANHYLAVKSVTGKWIAFATSLCILSPVCLIFLGGMSEYPMPNQFRLSEEVACGIGMVVLLLFVAAAVAIYIYAGSKTKPFAFLEKEPLQLEEDALSLVEMEAKRYHTTFVRFNIAGTVCCILSLLPLFSSLVTNSEPVMIVGLCLMFLPLAVGVFFFITAGVTGASFEHLLQTGEYTKTAKIAAKSPDAALFNQIYWPIITAGYLLTSFLSGCWEFSWIVWPLAGILCTPLRLIFVNRLKRKK